MRASLVIRHAEIVGDLGLLRPHALFLIAWGIEKAALVRPAPVGSLRVWVVRERLRMKIERAPSDGDGAGLGWSRGATD